MKKMKSYRFDEVTLARLDNLSLNLELSNTEIIDQLVNFGFDILFDFESDCNTELTCERFKRKLYDRYKLHKNDVEN